LKKNAKTLSKNRLVKTTTFLSLLVVAMMLISSVPASVQQNKTPIQNKQDNRLTTAVSKGVMTTQALSSSTPKRDDWIQIDDGVCVNAVGLTAGGTWETAARFTPAELGPYAGMVVDQVYIHFFGYYPDGTPETPESGYVKFYDAGTSSTPGSLLYEEPFTTPAQVGWFWVNLSSTVGIDGSKDMWISTEWDNQPAGAFPAGCDASPTSGKGDWAYINGLWYELGYGDWCIHGHVVQGGPPPQDNIKINSIDSPKSGLGNVFTPKITVQNKGYGNEDFTAEMQIQTQTVIPEQTIWQDNFDTGLSQWTVTNPYNYYAYWQVAGDYWGYYPSVPTYSSPYCAWCPTYYYDAYSYMTTTSPINLAGYTQARMSFETYYYYGYEYLYVYASSDGYSWNYLGMSYNYYYYNPSGQYTTGWGLANNVATYPYQPYFDLSAYAGGNVYIQILCSGGYWTDTYVDNVRVYAPQTTSWSTEYDRTADAHVDAGQTVQVSFPDWTPQAFHNVSNENVTYQVIAHAPLFNDSYPTDNWKNASIWLFFPYLHDIDVTGVRPNSDGMAQTLPVNVTIFNDGQFAERDFFVNAQIGQEIRTYATQTDFESDNGGWYENYGYWGQYGYYWTTWEWGQSYYQSAHSGTKAWWMGFYNEYYYDCNEQLSTQYYTVPSGGAIMSMWVNYNTYSGQDGANVKITTNYGSSWNLIGSVGAPYDSTLWSSNYAIPNEAAFSGNSNGWKLVSFDLSSYAGMTIQLRITFGSSGSYNFGGWFGIDDFSIYSVTIPLPEYDESAAQSSWLNPGESATLSYPAWTPYNLNHDETSGKFLYAITGTQTLGDDNDADDTLFTDFTLTYTHDVAVQKITSPALDKFDDEKAIAFCAYDPSGVIPNGVITYQTTTPGSITSINSWAPGSNGFCTGAAMVGDGTLFMSDYSGSNSEFWQVDPETGDHTLIGNMGQPIHALTYDPTTDTIFASSGSSFFSVDRSTGATTLIGGFGGGLSYVLQLGTTADGQVYCIDISTDNFYSVDKTTGAATMIGPTGVNLNFAQDMCYSAADTTMYVAGFDVNLYYGVEYTADVTTGTLTTIGEYQGGMEVDALAFPAGGHGPGPHPHPKPTVFVKLGSTTPIAGIVNNLGTFLETGLTCTADIWSFVTDPNGTGVYENSIGGISLNPLGGSQTLTFPSYTWADMGQYSVEVNLPLTAYKDDKLSNNDKAIGVGCDGTNPVTTITLSPAAPNGNNGWWVTNVDFTLKATDDMSGVASVWYSIDGAAAVPYSGKVTINTDGNHTIGYYAIDKVGNQETTHTQSVNIDKTFPAITLNKDILLNKIRYTALTNDNTSLLDRCEFWIGPYLQFTQVFTDPSGQQTAIWILTPVPHINISIEARSFDLAGNHNSQFADPLSLYLPGGQGQQVQGQELK